MEKNNTEVGFQKDGKWFGRYRRLEPYGHYVDWEGEGFAKESRGQIRLKVVSTTRALIELGTAAYEGESSDMLTALGMGTVTWPNLNCKWTGRIGKLSFVEDEGVLTLPDGSTKKVALDKNEWYSKKAEDNVKALIK